MLSKYLASPWVWLTWAIVSVGLTFPALLWHLDFFATYGPLFRKYFPILVISLVIACAACVYLRARGSWRYELAGVAGIALIVMAVYQPRATFLTILMATAQFALGRRTLRMLGFSFLGIAEEIALSFAAGMAETMGVLFILGLLHLYYASVFLAMLLLPCVVFFPEVTHLFRLLRRMHERWAALTAMQCAPAGVLMFFSAIFLVCSLAVILSPCLIYDALAYHLADARYYVESHALLALPFQPNSYLPQGFEVLMAALFALGGQAAAQMLSPLFFALTLLVAFALARRCGIAAHAALAGLTMIAATPFLLFEGVIVKNDFALAFFLLCALACCVRWTEDREIRWIYFSAVCLGSAFDIKHLALFGALPLGLVYLAAIRAQVHRFRTAIALALLFLIAGIYWQARTYVLMGNPVYPWALGDTVTVRTVGSRNSSSKLLRWIEIPWKAQFGGTGHFESKSHSPLGALLVFSLPVWLLGRRRTTFTPVEKVCLLFVGLYLLYWSSQWGVLRFAIAPIILLLLFLADRATRIYCSAPRLTRAILTCCLFYCGVVSLMVVTLLQVNGPELRIFAGQLDWPAYLRLWSSGYRSLEYLRSQARPGDRILSVDYCAAAYAPDPARFHGMCDDDFNSPEQIRAELGRENYRFLVLPKGSKMDPGQPAVFADKYFAVYQLSQ
jgi:4-amino-4-deoxy-L-arabinose transferase-like glycosyltransferase